MGQTGALATITAKMGVPIWIPSLFKGLVGLAFLGAVPGLWAGDGRAVPLAFLGAVGALLLGPGPAVMGVAAILCLTVFRETSQHQPA